MKTNRLKALFGSVAVATALFALPAMASAADVSASTTAGLRISHDGLVRVVGAEVTSISGNIVHAVTRFKDTVINWAFTTNSSTSIWTGTQGTSSPSGIRVGDRIAVAGTLTSLSGSANVAASKILDLTQLASWREKSGTVESVNAANGSFVLKTKDGKRVTVQTSNATTFKLSKATSTNTLANLPVGSKVSAYGTMNADGTVLSATKVEAKGSAFLKKEHKADKVKKDPHANGKGRDDEIHGLKSNFGLDFKFDLR